MAYYLDTSAFLKLVTTEPETPALRSWVQRKDPTLFSSDLLRTEAFRAARRYSAGADRSARRRLEALTLLSVTAGRLWTCRGSGSGHSGLVRCASLCFRLEPADDWRAIVTYGERLGVPAGLHGVAVVAPSGG
jgi:uncharacterized protein